MSSLNTGLSRLRRLLRSQKTGAHAYRIEARFELDFERRRLGLALRPIRVGMRENQIKRQSG